MGKKQRPISRPTPTSSPLPNKVNNAEQDDGTDVYHVQPIPKTPSISSHEPMSSDSNPNSKSKKRPNGNKIDGSLSPKRTKNEGSNAAAVVPSKSRFNRFWSYDDEITILKGMIDFISEKGSDPNKSINEFLSFIKNSLRAEASSTQLREKIRKLRLKFEKNGESPSFSSSHDSNLFELSKQIWGNAVAGITNKSLEKPESDGNKEGGNVKVVDFEKDAEIENVKVVDFEKDAEIENVKVVDFEKDAEIENDEEKNETMSYLRKALELSGLGNDFINKGIELLGESTRMEMKKLWKEVEITEFELSVRRVELVAKQNRLIVETLKSSNH